LYFSVSVTSLELPSPAIENTWVQGLSSAHSSGTALLTLSQP